MGNEDGDVEIEEVLSWFGNKTGSHGEPLSDGNE